MAGRASSGLPPSLPRARRRGERWPARSWPGRGRQHARGALRPSTGVPHQMDSPRANLDPRTANRARLAQPPFDARAADNHRPTLRVVAFVHRAVSPHPAASCAAYAAFVRPAPLCLHPQRTEELPINVRHVTPLSIKNETGRARARLRRTFKKPSTGLA